MSSPVKRRLLFGNAEEIPPVPTVNLFNQQTSTKKVSEAASPLLGVPLPNFENIKRGIQHRTFNCPPTPAPKKQRSEESPNVREGVPFSVRRWDGNGNLDLKPIQKLGSGDHGTAWRVQMPDGSQKVYKVDVQSTPLNIREEFYQYHQLRNIGFPVAVHDDLEYFINEEKPKKIFTIQTKSERDERLTQYVKKKLTHGYHLREFVAHPFPENKPIDSPWYDQLKQMFKIAYQNRIAVDLQKQNVGYNLVDREPKLKYYDLMPHDEDDEIPDVNPFGLIVKRCLETFAPKNSPLYKALDPRES